MATPPACVEHCRRARARGRALEVSRPVGTAVVRDLGRRRAGAGGWSYSSVQLQGLQLESGKSKGTPGSKPLLWITRLLVTIERIVKFPGLFLQICAFVYAPYIFRSSYKTACSWFKSVMLQLHLLLQSSVSSVVRHGVSSRTRHTLRHKVGSRESNENPPAAWPVGRRQLPHKPNNGGNIDTSVHAPAPTRRRS